MIRAALDINILISGFIAPGETIGSIMQHWQQQKFTLLISSGMLIELHEKLVLPKIMQDYDISPEDISSIVNLLYMFGENISVLPKDHKRITGDPEDDYILATAKKGSADYLVTGDKKLARVGLYGRTKLVRPREFTEIF